MMVWFSAVTTTRALAAASWTVAVSRGLTVGTLMTETETAWLASARAAASAAASIMPLANRATSSPAQDLGLAHPQHVILAEDDRDLTALEPDVHRPRQVDHGRGDLADLHRVRDVHDGHVRQRAHQRDIVDRLMARAAGRRAPGHEADDPHRQARVRDGVGDLVEGAAGGEDVERVHERDVAAAGQRPGHAHHVRLGHPGVDEPVRDLRLEQVHLTLPGQVAAEAKDLAPAAGQVDQGPAVGLELGGVGRLTHEGPPACR